MDVSMYNLSDGVTVMAKVYYKTWPLNAPTLSRAKVLLISMLHL